MTYTLVFQRTLLIFMVNVKRSGRTRNEYLHKTTKITSWSCTIRIKRLKWLGHLLLLDENTTARKALEESTRPVKRSVERPMPTWISQIQKDLQKLHPTLNLKKAEEMVNKDRFAWRRLVTCAMVQGDRKA